MVRSVRWVGILVVLTVVLPQLAGAQAQGTTAANGVSAAQYCQALANGNPQAQALKSVCEFALNLPQRAANYTCDVKLKRSGPIGSGGGNLTEYIDARVALKDGGESYSDLRFNGVATDRINSDMPSIQSAGELNTQIYHLFLPDNKAKFKFNKEVTLNKTPALQFSFEMEEGDNQSFKVWNLDGQKTRPGYKGTLWLDKSSLRPVRLHMVSKPLRFRAPFDDVRYETDYSEVAAGDPLPVLVPAKSTANACATTFCLHSDMQMVNCQKLGEGAVGK